MNSKLLTIKQASKMLGVTTQTMRRWDKNGLLTSMRGKNNYRYYKPEDVKSYIKNPRDFLRLAKTWAINNTGIEPNADFYCSSSSIFQARLSKLESELNQIRELNKIFPLITAITGEIGNNSFDHNLGNWPDIPGIFFAYNLEKRKIILADRGQGILATLKKVKSDLKNHQDALKVAFTEIISGRAPESRGNGLKFVKQVVFDNKISLFFQTGNAQLKVQKKDSKLNIKKSKINFHGCLAIIKF